MADPQHDAILIHLEYLRKGVDETNAHLRRVNGRVGAVEDDLLVLKTRADEAKKGSRHWGAGTGAIGGFLGGLLAGFLGKGQ